MEKKTHRIHLPSTEGYYSKHHLPGDEPEIKKKASTQTHVIVGSRMVIIWISSEVGRMRNQILLGSITSTLAAPDYGSIILTFLPTSHENFWGDKNERTWCVRLELYLSLDEHDELRVRAGALFFTPFHPLSTTSSQVHYVWDTTACQNSCHHRCPPAVENFQISTTSLLTFGP